MSKRKMAAFVGLVPVGQLRRVNIGDVVVYDADPCYSSIISGVPGHDIEDVKLSNVRIYCRGGGTQEDAALAPPERENAYPEPSMFGKMPAHGFFIRHAKGLQMDNVEVGFLKEDLRPAFVLDDVKGAEFNNVKAQATAEVPTFVLKSVNDFATHHCKPVADMKLDRAEEKKL